MVVTLPPGALGPDGALRAAQAALPIGTRLGEFEVTDVIGEGGFGIVYVAEDHLLGRQVALKEYMPSGLASRGAQAEVSVRSARHADTFEAGRRSFINEARLLAQFDHPALVKVFRFWEANGTAYMVMPYYRGRTLRQALADMGSPPSQAWLKLLLLPLVDALQAMHAAQCYHRDIAPDNILLLDSGKPVLLDFGAARRVIGDITQALTVILKPGFAPLEQYANGPEARQGPWTDVYALAAVIYYCATLKAPVPAVSRMMKDTLAPFASLAGDRYDDDFCAAVDRGLAVSVDERIQDMAAFREALRLDDAAAGFDRPGARDPTSGRGGDLEATIIDSAALRRTEGQARQRQPVSPHAATNERFDEDKDMNASSPGSAPHSPPPRPASRQKGEQSWTPNADVQLERIAADAQAAAAGGRRSMLLPTAGAIVALVAAGIGGYWLLSEPETPTEQTGQQAQFPPAPTTPTAPPPPVSSSPATPAPATPPSPGQQATAPAAPAPSPPGPSPAPAPSSAFPSLVPDQGSAAGASGSLPVGRIIDELYQQRDQGWPVSVRVASDRVKIGQDRLRFHLRSERDGYVYLLMQGTDRAHFYQLFPNELDRNNRVRGNADLALPRDNWEMVAGGPPGMNRFIALVTPTPRDFSAAGLDKGQPFSEFDLQAANRIFAAKGASAFAGEPANCQQAPQSCAAYGAALFEIEEYE